MIKVTEEMRAAGYAELGLPDAIQTEIDKRNAWYKTDEGQAFIKGFHELDLDADGCAHFGHYYGEPVRDRYGAGETTALCHFCGYEITLHKGDGEGE